MVSWEQRVRIALDAARGLEYLHEKVQPAVTHKDVRSTNVLLFEGFRAKIADYNMFSQAADMARLNRSTHTLGSFGYQAPEYVHARTHTSPADLCLDMADRSRHGFLVVGLGRRTILLKFSLVWGCSRYAMTGQMNDKSDVYSFGIVLLELLTGRKPLDRTLPQGQRSLVNWATPILTEDRVQDCIDPNLGDKYPPTGALKVSLLTIHLHCIFAPNHYHLYLCISSRFLLLTVRVWQCPNAAGENRGAVPAVRPYVPAIDGHRCPRHQLRRRARPARRGLMIHEDFFFFLHLFILICSCESTVYMPCVVQAS